MLLAFENSFSRKRQHDDGRAVHSILVAISHEREGGDGEEHSHILSHLCLCVADRGSGGKNVIFSNSPNSIFEYSNLL